MKSGEPESLPSLKVLIEQALSPDAGRAEVDALLLGLAQPPRPGEEAHERAELLHRILDDKRLRSFTGSQGRRVHAAAAQALVALGEPHARELSPEDLAAMRAAEARASRSTAEPVVSQDEAHAPPPEGLSRRQKWGRGLLMTVGAIELYVILFHIAPRAGFSLGPLVYSLGTTFVPAWLAPSPKAVAHRSRHFFYLGLALLPFPAMTLGALAFFLLGSSKPKMMDYMFLIGPVALALARLVSVVLMYTRPRN